MATPHHVPDFTLPHFQNEPSCAAILDFLRRLTPHFLLVSRELTDAEWTAFHALAKKGAAEGILQIVCTPEHATEAVTEYHHIQGDYVNAMIPGFIRRDRPIDDRLVQARLTAMGQRLAGVLQLEKTEDTTKVRAAVLEMLWRKPIKLGSDHMIPPPDAATLTAADVAPGAASMSDEERRKAMHEGGLKGGPQATTGTAKDTSNPLRRGPKPDETCEEKAYKYLLTHGHRNNVSCREIEKNIGYSKSRIIKTKAWKAYQKRRENEAEQNRKRLSGNQGMDDDFVNEE